MMDHVLIGTLQRTGRLLRTSRYFAELKDGTSRFLATQADVPPIIGHAKPTDASGTNSSSTNQPSHDKSPESTPEAAPLHPDARMTSAGILLPKDSAQKLKTDDETDDKRHNKTSSESKKSTKTFRSMKAWQISRFGDIDSMKLVEDCRVPKLSDPSDLLVEVHAASVNPFDVQRTRGYGENLIQYMRNFSNFSWLPQLPFTKAESPFPITLGRDFSGVVVDVGKMVKGIKAGDEVYGVIGPHRQGTFAEYAATSTWCVAKKPKSISHTDAASFPYVACTAWSVLKLISNAPTKNKEEIRVLVLGGSGGVGSFAIQYCKTLGVHVTAVCGSEALDLVASLGADDVIDYKLANVETELQQRGKFDVIFQASGGQYDYTKRYLKGNLQSFYVTLNYNLLQNFDSYGGVAGLAKSAAEYSAEYLKGASKGYHTVWGFFTPNGGFLNEVAKLVDKNQIRPVIDKVYPFEDLPLAFQQVDVGETKGKVVVQIK